jgi:hypothetical protein
LPTGRPFLIFREAQRWAVRFDNLRKAEKSKDN